MDALEETFEMFEVRTWRYRRDCESNRAPLKCGQKGHNWLCLPSPGGS